MRYVALATTTAGRTLVSRAPTRTPMTTSPGVNPGPLILQRRGAAGRRLGNLSGLRRTRHPTSQSASSARVPLVAPQARKVLKRRLGAGGGTHLLVKLPARLAAFPYPYTQYTAGSPLPRFFHPAV